MLQVSHITKTYNSGAGGVTAVNDVTFEVPTGVFAAIVGKSGSGKSTLLALLGALDKPTSGAIKVGDGVITSMRDHALIAYRRDAIGFVFQGYNLIPNLSALENVMLPMEFAGKRKAERRARAEELLSQVGIEGDKQRRRPGRLSGGEQQRVAIARALANHPKLILADEPTGNLDSTTSDLIVKLLRGLAKDHKTTILAVTHDNEIAALADVTFRLADGNLTKEHGGPAPAPKARRTTRTML